MMLCPEADDGVGILHHPIPPGTTKVETCTEKPWQRRPYFTLPAGRDSIIVAAKGDLIASISSALGRPVMVMILSS